MLKLYVQLAWRHLAKNKIYSLINIAGLSLSLACAMLMILYAKDELSFDKFHTHAGLIYRIGIDVRFPDGSSMEKMGATGVLHGPRFKANLSEIESYVRLANTHRDIKIGGNVQSQPVTLVDANFFDMFTFALLEGDPRGALQRSDQIVITEDVAKRIFGDHNALNQVIEFESNGSFVPYTVSGVAKSVPQNSSIQFEVLMPLVVPSDQQTPDSWVQIDLNTFVKLSPGSDVDAVNAKMQRVYDVESKEVMDKVHASGFEQDFYHQLQPLADIHLDQEYRANDGLTRGSDPTYSLALSGIAALILIIACINFINLTIARSLKRAKEIGIRKVIGSQRKQLVIQFLGESFFLSCASFVGGVLLTEILLPPFNDVVNKALSLSYLADFWLAGIFIFLLMATSFLAGFYPAIVLSGFSPVQTLYGRFRVGGKNYFQKGLIVFQFTVATLLIIATVAISTQFEYLTTTDLGYDAGNVVKVTKRSLTVREASVFGQELLRNSNIVAVASQRYESNNAKIHGENISHFDDMIIDDNFLNVLKIPIVAGRNFSASIPTDSSQAVLVNEEFVKMAGWRDPIGQEVNLFLAGKKKTVIGVVKDYHLKSLSHPIEPLMFELNSGDARLAYREMLIKIKPNSESNSLLHIEQTFRKLFPMVPYSYQFLDDINKRNYEAEAKWKKVILLSAFLTIFIACLGLLGLSILTAEKRFKEIGIRKVLGASVAVITVTLCKDIVRFVSIALLLGMPLSYFITETWLQTYPYRVNVGPGVYVGTAVIVFLVALATVSYQTIKSALSNPIEALRSE